MSGASRVGYIAKKGFDGGGVVERDETVVVGPFGACMALDNPQVVARQGCKGLPEVRDECLFICRKLG